MIFFTEVDCIGNIQIIYMEETKIGLRAIGLMIQTNKTHNIFKKRSHSIIRTRCYKALLIKLRRLVVVCFVSDMKHQEAWNRVVSMYMAVKVSKVVADHNDLLTH